MNVQQTKSGNYMKIKNKKNDAFRVLQAITRDGVRDLENHIIDRLRSERLMFGDREDAGKSLSDVSESNGMNIHDFVDVMFPTVKFKDEIPELSKHIFFHGDGAKNPCPECGCELEIEPDGEWLDVKCSNTECDFRDSTEPDHDIFPGGHSFDN